MGLLYFWGRSIQEMGGNVVIGRSIYAGVVINGSLYSRFYGIATRPEVEFRVLWLLKKSFTL